MTTEMLLERPVDEAAAKPALRAQAPDENFSEAVWKMRDAFRMFESQSSLLQSQYEGIKKNLAFSNRQLNAKNMALSEKVEELRRMSSRLQCILESLTDGVLVVDEDLRIERCNLAIESMLGLPREEIEGVPYDQITNGFGNAAMLQMAIRNGRSFLDQERSSTTRSGDRITVLASVAPIRSGSGVILGAVEILRNVTTLRFLEERVNCQKRMAALGEMAASVAHEIRNPLGTIEGFARLLKRDLEDSPDHVKLAGKIVEGVQNLNYVITSLLTYARPMALQCEMFDVEKLIGGVEDILVQHAQKGQVKITIDKPVPGFAVNGDIRQIKQVVVNIGVNAIEACSAGGTVRVSAKREGKSAVIVIADNGCGISESDLTKIFDPFFTRKESGTGLGLSLCHKIITAHGGEINVSSNVGKGSVFEITMPGAGELL